MIGVDYPKPIVDHTAVSKENMGKIAKAYAAHAARSTGASAGGSNAVQGSSGSSSHSKGGSESSVAGGNKRGQGVQQKLPVTKVPRQASKEGSEGH